MTVHNHFDGTARRESSEISDGALGRHAPELA